MRTWSFFLYNIVIVDVGVCLFLFRFLAQIYSYVDILKQVRVSASKYINVVF